MANFGILGHIKVKCYFSSLTFNDIIYYFGTLSQIVSPTKQEMMDVYLFIRFRRMLPELTVLLPGLLRMRPIGGRGSVQPSLGVDCMASCSDKGAIPLRCCGSYFSVGVKKLQGQKQSKEERVYFSY